MADAFVPTEGLNFGAGVYALIGSSGEAPAAAGQWSTNNADPSLVTQVKMWTTGLYGSSGQAFLESLIPLDRLTFSAPTSAEASGSPVVHVYRVTAAPSAAVGNVLTLAVAYEGGNGTGYSGKKYGVAFARAPFVDWAAAGPEQVDASRYSSGTGGATNTVAAIDPVENAGDNTNASIALVVKPEGSIIGVPLGGGAQRPTAITPAQTRAALNVANGATDDTTATAAQAAAAAAQGTADAALPKAGGALTGPVTTSSTITHPDTDHPSIATADAKAVAAQSDATQGIADAATADAKAVSAQADATQGIADAAAAQATANAAIPATEKGAVNGVATLGVGGTVPPSQLPAELMEFKGGWNAATNTPSLTLPYSGSIGDRYRVTVAGTVNLGGAAGPTAYGIGDWLMYDGSDWVYTPASAASGGQVDSVVAGAQLAVDATDPVNPIVSLPPQILADFNPVIQDRDLVADSIKLDGIEAAATADQTGAEIKTAYEAEADTNAYTDAEKTKLAGTPIVRRDVTANRGAASSFPDQFFYDTTENILYRSDGTNWYGTGDVRSDVLANRGTASDWAKTFFLTTDTGVTLTDLLYYSDGSSWIAPRQSFALLDVSASNRVLGRTTAGAGAAEMLTPLDVSSMIAKDNVGIEHDPVNGLQLKDGGVGKTKLDMTGAVAGEIATVQAGATDWDWSPSPVSARAPVVATTTPTNPFGTWLLDTEFQNGSVLDGVTLATGDRVLIKDATSTTIGTYTYDDTVVPSADGHAQPNNSDGAQVSSIIFWDTNAASVDNSATFANIRSGDRIRLDWLTYYATGPAVDNGTSWTVPVKYWPSTVPTFPATQSTTVENNLFNGIYTVNATGAPTRATDFGAAASVAAAQIFIRSGDTNGRRIFIVTNDPGSDIVDTHALFFEELRYDTHSTGFGAFQVSPEDASGNADNGAFHVGTGMQVANAENFGIKFSGKPWGRVPGWGFGGGSPIHVQGLMSQAGGAGSFITMRAVDDPSQICMYRINAPPFLSTTINDDTWYKDITLLGTTFDIFDATKLYSVNVTPQAPTAAYSGSAVIDLAASVTFGDFWTWPAQQSWQSTAWTKAGGFTSSNTPTNAPWDHAGILMPSNGCIVQLWCQGYVQDLAVSTVNLKPDLYRSRVTPGTSTVSTAAMQNTSLTNNMACSYGLLSDFTANNEGTFATQITDATFQAGDKLLLTLEEVASTGSPTTFRLEWAIKLVFFDALPTGEAPGDGL